MVQEQSSCWDSASALDEPAIAASAEAQVTHAVRRATSAFTAFLHDNFGVIGFVQIPRLVTSLQKSSTTDVCAGIVPLLAHSHEGFVKMPHRRGGAPTLDESMIVPSSRSFYQAQRYVALATQVLAVAFCPEDDDDASRTHRTVTTAQFASAFLEHLDARTKVLITAINRAEAAGALDAKRNGPRRFDKDLDLCIDRHLIAALEATIRTPPDVRLAALEKAMFPFFNALFQAAEEADNVRDDTAATDDTSNEGGASDASSSEGASDGDTRRKSAPRDRSTRDRANSGKQSKSKPTSSSLPKQSSGIVMLKRDEIAQSITLSDADLALLADMASADAQQESEELFLVDNGRPRSLAASCRWCTQTEYAELFQSLFRAYPQPAHDQRDHRNAVLQALSEAIQDTSPKLSLAVKVRLLLLCKWHRNPPPGLSMGRSDPAKAAANPAALTAPPGSMSFTAGNGATSLRWRDNRATPAGSSHNNNDANVALAGLTPVPATRNDAARVMAARDVAEPRPESLAQADHMSEMSRNIATLAASMSVLLEERATHVSSAEPGQTSATLRPTSGDPEDGAFAIAASTPADPASSHRQPHTFGVAVDDPTASDDEAHYIAQRDHSAFAQTVLLAALAATQPTDEVRFADCQLLSGAVSRGEGPGEVSTIWISADSGMTFDLKALIDTGASTSLLTESFLNSIGITFADDGSLVNPARPPPWLLDVIRLVDGDGYVSASGGPRIMYKKDALAVTRFGGPE